MSTGKERPFVNFDSEDEFLIPPGQQGSLVDRLAPAETEQVFITPEGMNVVILVGSVAAVVVVRRATL